MTKPNTSFFWIIGATLFFFLVAKSIELFYNETRLLDSYKETIETHLHEQEQQISILLSDTAFVNSKYHSSINRSTNLFKDPTKTFNLCIYDKEHLSFWSHSIAFPDLSILTTLKSDSVLFRKLSNGYYRIAKHSIPEFALTEKYAVSLIPIKWAYPTSLKHLNEQFEPSHHIFSSNLEITAEQTPFSISDAEGRHLCYLQQSGIIKDKGVLSWVLLFYILSFLLFGYLLNMIALQLNQIYKSKAWIGPCFLLFAVFGIRYLSIYLGWTERFDELQVFKRSFQGANISISDLLINIILLLWIVIFFHRESKAKLLSTDFSKEIRFLLTTMNYLSVVLALLLLISVFKSLVLNSGVPFDFKNVFNLEPYSVVAVMGIILLLFTLFIFCHRMMLSIRQIFLSRQMRLMSLGVATLLSLPIIYFIDLQIPLHFSALIAFIFILTYDLFVDFENPGLIWLVVWIIFFAGFSSGLLNKYNYDKEISDELSIAKSLATEEDRYAQEAFKNMDASLSTSLKKNSAIETSQLIETIKKAVFEENYLYNNYDFVVHTQQDSTGLEGSFDKLQNQIQSSQLLQDEDNLYFNTNRAGQMAYFIDMSKYQPQPVIVEFKKSAKKLATVYSELLSNKLYKDLTGLDNYNYAIYKNNVLVESYGVSLNKVSDVFDTFPQRDDYKRIVHDGHTDFLYNYDDNTFVLLSKEKNGFFHPISLFSYIFGLLIMTVLFFALINVKLKILPDNLNFNVGKKPSLKNRIQFSIILLILLSFLIIAFVSFLFLRNNWIDYHDSRLKRKVRSVQLESEEWLHYQGDSIEFLKERVPRLAVTHRSDVNLYDLNGNLINSSQEDVYKRGILPRKMNAGAFFEFKHITGKDYYQSEEKIGNQSFKTAYVPLKNLYGQNVAYLGVPYYTKQRSLDDEISDFMGSLLNVYVFLLLVAGLISIFVANSITRPLTQIGEKLQEVKLGKPNTPLNWETNDEIGTLVSEYNEMIVKLEDSANLLAKSEREGAWREMAKQVAHEIKNPLTPMKLSIQYLNHAYKSRPDDIESLMQRVSNTLIEQIDNLAHIANEFSNFAKMPRANNQEFLLNDLVESVHGLFKERNDADVLLNLPDLNFMVFADKNQLMRVLNNLIKNAIEAIPDNRRGQIEVSLFEREKMAVIKVSDNGVGIPEEMKKKVFVPNFTTKNSGTGLGLAISKNIIESVNGKIYYETEHNVGTDFYVELPIESSAVLEMA